MKQESKQTVKKTTVVTNTSTSPTNMITKDYADILVNHLLNTTESIVILNARSKLQFYDSKLKSMGLRATIKIGIEKID
jgi:hypothetical protein